MRGGKTERVRCFAGHGQTHGDYFLCVNHNESPLNVLIAAFKGLVNYIYWQHFIIHLTQLTSKTLFTVSSCFRQISFFGIDKRSTMGDYDWHFHYFLINCINNWQMNVKISVSCSSSSVAKSFTTWIKHGWCEAEREVKPSGINDEVNISLSAPAARSLGFLCLCCRNFCIWNLLILKRKQTTDLQHFQNGIVVVVDRIAFLRAWRREEVINTTLEIRKESMFIQEVNWNCRNIYIEFGQKRQKLLQWCSLHSNDMVWVMLLLCTDK